MTTEEPTPPRVLDAGALRALAHPLRAQLFNLLSFYGPATATSLADRVGESSGSTSYHLRQLERHGLVREDAARGNARDRWWERVPGPVFIGSPDEQDPATRSAQYIVARELGRSQEHELDEYLRRGEDELPPEWVRAAAIGAAALRLTSRELAELTREIDGVVERYRDRAVAHDRPGTRPVQVAYRAFPLMDGVELRAEEPLPSNGPDG
jgi:DNA-binding transcriptional ArsR family regulator